MMAFSRLVAYATLAAIAGLLGGCGGVFPQPCGGADYGAGNPGYAAAYTGTFTGDASSGSSNNLSFAINLDEQGRISGTATEVATGKTGTVTGDVIDWYNPCSSDKTYVNMSFSLSGEATRHCDGSRNRTSTLSTPMGASYSINTTPTSSDLLAKGALVLTKQTP